MRNLKLAIAGASALLASTSLTSAADLIPTPTYDAPAEIEVSGMATGWYIRGDIGYTSNDHRGVHYLQGNAFNGSFETHDLDSNWMLQGGIGYQLTDYARVDLTLAHFTSASFSGSSAQGATCNGFGAPATCDYSDTAELESVNLFMANAYWDMGTFSGFTPYVGAGIGGAKVKWGTLMNDQTCSAGSPAGCSDNDFKHPGQSSTRFAWQLHAGASYDIRCDLKLDGGYTYTKIKGGKMFGEAYNATTNAYVGGGVGYDNGLEMHTGRVGLRYQLGGCSHAAEPEIPVVYK